MFRDEEKYREYLNRQGVEKTNISQENYFEYSDNGEIIIKNKDYTNSAIDVNNYTNCIRWILLKDNRTMALLKYPFGDIYRNLTKEQYYIALYNNILLPQIAEQLQNECAKYYIVKGNKLSNNMKHLLTIDFKSEDEEIIHGEEIIENAGGDKDELNIKDIIYFMHKYLVELGVSSQDIHRIKREFVKQSLFNRFVKQSDENNHNWGVLINRENNRARIAPIYDLDCCCDIATRRRHKRTTQDGNRDSISSLIQDFGKYEWFILYVKEILERFDLNQAIEYSKKATRVEIPESIQNYYRNFFGERYYELKGAYQEYIKEQQNIHSEEEPNSER